MNKGKRKLIEYTLASPEDGKILDLSKEQLTVRDYRWLASVIPHASFLETLVLPKIINTDVVFGILDEVTAKNSTLISIQAETEQEYSSPVKDRIQSRLQRNSRRIFGIHGGGNIGLGLMADIISKSPFKYNILATTGRENLRTLINSVHKFWIQHGTQGDSGCSSDGVQADVTCIENVEMITRSTEDIIRLYTESCMVAVCVTPDVLTRIAKDIAMALQHRYDIDGSGVKILILMNLPRCDKLAHEKVMCELMKITDERRAQEILSKSDFIPTVIDRIVTRIDDELIEEQLRAQLLELPEENLNIGEKHSFLSSLQNILQAPYKFLFKSSEPAVRLPATGLTILSDRQEDARIYSDKIDAILHEPEKLAAAVAEFNLQFNVLNAEREFTMYADDFQEASRLPEITVSKDLTRIETVKNKFINGPHAILAWLGALLGYTTVGEAIKNKVLHQFTKELMQKEILPILHLEYPEITRDEFAKLSEAFLERCQESADDPVLRVGRDSLRKLNKGDRIRGTLELAECHRADIATPRLEQGIAAGLVYASVIENIKGSLRDILCRGGGDGAAAGRKYVGMQEGTEIVERILLKAERLKSWYEREISEDQNTISEELTGDVIAQLGITVDQCTGHMMYSSTFQPLSLDFSLILIRHGETYGNCGQCTASGEIDDAMVLSGIKNNDQRVFQGNVDLSVNQLTPYGREQALRVAEELDEKFLDRGWEPDIILCSPMTRARDTAAPFVKQNYLEDRFVIDEGLREMAFGAWENRRVCDLPAESPCHKFYLEQNVLVKEQTDMQQAENFCDVLVRAYRVLFRLNRTYPKKHIIMFTHSMFAAACRILLGKSPISASEPKHLIFDGTAEGGGFNTFPHATPVAMNFEERNTYEEEISCDYEQLIKELFFDTVSKSALTVPTTEESPTVGPRELPGWTLKDTEDPCNFFYDAVLNQLQLIGHSFMNEIPVDVTPKTWLKIKLQGYEETCDGLYAALTEKLIVQLAVLDTRNPAEGFKYYGQEGNPLIKIAFTGDHYLSVLAHP